MDKETTGTCTMTGSHAGFPLAIQISCGWSPRILFRGFLWNSMKQTQRLTGHLDQRELTSCDVRKKKNNTSPLNYLNVQWQKAREVNNVLNVAHIHTHFIHKTSRKMRDKTKKCISGSRHTVIPAPILRIQQLKLTSANCPSTSQ